MKKRGDMDSMDIKILTDFRPLSDFVKGPNDLIVKVNKTNLMEYKLTPLEGRLNAIPGQFNIIQGEPGSGKSVFVDQLLISLMHQKLKIMICSMERTYQQCASDLAHLITGGDKSRLSEAYDILSERLAIIPYADFDNRLDLIKNYIIRHGESYQMIVIDPYQSLAKSINEFENANAACDACKALAVTYGHIVWLVCHPKVIEDKKTALDLNTIGGGAAFGRKCDNMIGFYRGKDENRISFIKIKREEINKKGEDVKVKYHKQGRFFYEDKNAGRK